MSAPALSERSSPFGPGVSIDSLDFEVLIQRQHAALSLMHAINNALQCFVLSQSVMQAALDASGAPTRALAVGGCSAADLGVYVRNVAPTLQIILGSPHFGKSGGTAWTTTLHAQHHRTSTLDFAILLLRCDAAASPATPPHAVAARKFASATTGPQWYIVDSHSGTRLYPLSSPECALAFDADVLYFTMSSRERRAATCQTVRDALLKTRGHQEIVRSCSASPLTWLGGPTCPWDGYQRSPTILLVFAPVEVRLNRHLFLRICSHVGMPMLACARFEHRSGKRALTGHMRLTVHRQTDLYHLELAMQCMIRSVLAHSGWRVVAETRTQHECVAGPVMSNPLDTHASEFSLLQADGDMCVDDNPARPRSRQAPAPARQHDCDVLGTLNVHGISGESSADKLLNVTCMMHARRVGVLAVQETWLGPGAMPPAVDADVVYMGEPGRLGATRALGGEGFLIHADWRHRSKYLGRRASATPHAPVWLKVAGGDAQRNVFVGCVYLPNSSTFATATGKRQFIEALAATEADVDHFQSRGLVVLVGDFNAWVGNPSAWRAPQHAARAARAPRHGDSRKNLQGGLLLDMCARSGLSFLSAQTLPATPTFYGSHAAAAAVAVSAAELPSASVHDLGHATMLDHVLTTDAACLPTALTLQHALPDVRACATDHVPVLVAALPVRDSRGPERVRRTTWRLECLHEATQAAEYRAQVQVHILQACVDGGLDMTVQQLAEAVTAGITTAAHATIGQRIVVPRITVPWLTDALTKQAIRDRRTAHVDMVTTEAHLERLQQRRARGERAATELAVLAVAWRAHEAALAFRVCKRLATAAVTAARRAWRTKCADRLNHNVLKRPSSRHTYALLLCSSQSQVGPTGPEELRMPGTTDEYHDTIDGMLACFAQHYESLGTPAPACTPHTDASTDAIGRVRAPWHWTRLPLMSHAF